MECAKKLPGGWNCCAHRALRVIGLWDGLRGIGVQDDLLRGLLSAYGYTSRKQLDDFEADEFADNLTNLLAELQKQRAVRSTTFTYFAPAVFHYPL